MAYLLARYLGSNKLSPTYTLINYSVGVQVCCKWIEPFILYKNEGF